jgi:hypothetical protein
MAQQVSRLRLLGQFKPGGTNIVADALSHRDTKETGEVMALIAPTF